MKINDILNEGAKPGLWANIHAKRERIKHGSGEHMRKPGSKGAPTAQAFKDAAKTSKTDEAANPAQQAAIAIAMKKKGQKPQNENAEYDDEAGMFKNDLQTIQRVSRHLEKEILDNENLPEWCQAKIAQAKGMIVNVMDYMISQHENGETDTVEEDWQKANKSDKTDGMSPKAVKAYRRENPGSKLQTAVTTKPSKLKPGSKAAKRRKSFCARMSGNKGPMKDEKGRPTPKAKALRRWNCEE